LIVNAVGVDRLGIVSEISKHVTDIGGNVGESQAAKLGSHFSMMMLVKVPSEKKEELEAQLKTLKGMSTTVLETDVSASEFTPKIACKFLRDFSCYSYMHLFWTKGQSHTIASTTV
jgi:glycine cleavage system regulatory protein